LQVMQPGRLRSGAQLSWDLRPFFVFVAWHWSIARNQRGRQVISRERCF
jgi:hypothetical protein